MRVFVTALQALDFFRLLFTRAAARRTRFSPGFHMTGFQPSNSLRIAGLVTARVRRF